jgi:hypothetical protein
MSCPKVINDPLKKELLRAQKAFESDPRIKAFGYGDPSTGEWLWNKYVGTPRDPLKPITPTELNKYKEGLKEFSETLGAKENPFLRFFKLPKALMRKLPETNNFIQEMSNATSFRQKQLKEAAVYMNEMIDNGLYKMMLSGDYHGGALWSKKELKRYQNLELQLEQAKTPEQRKEALKKIVEVVGVKDGNNNPVGGKVLRRFNDLLTFKAQDTPLTPTEKSIVENWNKLRFRSAKLLLNGIEQSKAIIKESVKSEGPRKDLMNALEKLQAAAERIHFQQSVDSKMLVDPDGLFSLKGKANELKVYDAETGLTKPYKMIDANGERVIPRELTKYAPEYVIEISNAVRNLVDYASNTKDVKWQNKTSRQVKLEIDKNVDLGRMINRLKARTDVGDSRFSSLDPIFTLNKYVNDVAHFNYTTRINLSYKKAADKLWDISRRKGVSNELGEYSRHMVDLMTEIKKSALNNYEGGVTEMDNVVRFINGMEYVSKLGWSVRGGLRNRSQMLFDWVKYGHKAWTVSSEFYNANKLHEQMATEQLGRFGILFGEKAQLVGTSVATAGSLEKVAPQGTKMTPEAGLKRAETSVTEIAAEKMSEFVDKSGATKPLQMAENANRVGTFKRAFAMAYTEMAKNPDFFRRQWMESKKTKDKTPTDEVLRDYMANLAGNQAAKVTRDLHFEYENWAKAKILQTKTGKVVGQFQTYRFALWDLQWQMLKDAKRAGKAGKYGLFEQNAQGQITRIMPEIQQAMRYLSLYALIVPLASAVTNFDFSNLVQNETYDTAERFLKYYTADEEDREQLEDKYGQFFGKPALAGNLGPFVSDILTIADLLDVYDSTPEELQETMKMRYNPDDPNWWYKMSRVANIQAARTGWHTIPAFLEDQYERMFRVETGLYKPKHMFDWMRNSDDAFFKQRKDWLDNNPYSPARWIYTGERMFGVGPALPSLEGRRKKSKKNKQAVNVLERMLAGEF